MRPLRPIEASLLQDLIAQGEGILDQPAEILLSLAQDPLTPRALLEVLVNRADAAVADVARLHVNWAGELADWHTEIDAVFQTAQLGQNDRLAVELLKLGPVPPAFLSEWVPANVLIQALKNPHMPLRYRLKLLERLAQEPTLDPRLQVAESPETPLTVLEQLVGDLELPVRLATKYNPACPSALVQLVEGHQLIACDWSTDAEQLTNLGRSRWDWIRLAVAQNPSASAETLMELANDRVFKIQLAVAKNSGTPSSVLTVLAERPEAVVQAAIAAHPNATETILNQVFPTQQQALMQRKNLPVSILRRFFDERSTATPLWRNQNLRYFLMQQPNTPTSVLAEFAGVDLEAVRADLVANHPQNPPEIIEQWVIGNTEFLAEVARHPNISDEILQDLVQYSSEKVQLAVASNPLMPESLRIQLLEQLLEGSEHRIKVEIAKNSQTPLMILEKLADASTNINLTVAALRSIVPSISSALCDRISGFISHRQSSKQILFWLRQDAAFRDPILQEWHELIVSLDDIDHQVIKALGMSVLPMIGMSGGVPRQDRVWLGENPFKSENELTEDYILYGLLIWSEISNSNDNANKELVVALLGNPSLPGSLRDRLWQEHRQEPDDFGRYHKDMSLRMALACNLSVPELERLEFLRQIVDSNSRDMPDALIKSLHTPVSILERIAERGEGGVQQVVKSPNAPVNILRQAVQQDNSYTLRLVAENPNTPLDLLKSLALHPDRGIRDTVLKNPNLDPLTVYQLQLELQAQEELTQASQVLAGRPDSPYALAQVLEKGDRNAKITAARSLKTPISVLEELARDVDDTVRSVVSENQNLPINSLIELTRDSNINIRANLARHRRNRQVPALILERLATDEAEQVRSQVANNPDTPIEILNQLAQDPSFEVCRALSQNLNASEIILEIIAVQKGIANPYNSKTPGNAFSAAIEQALQTDFRFRDKAVDDLLKNHTSQVPAKILEKLAESYKTDWVRSSIAHHSNTPDTALRLMVDDVYGPVLWGIARNRNTSPELLNQLLDHPNLSPQDYQQIYGAIIERVVIPLNIIERLLEIAQPPIRQRVVTRDNLSEALINRLIATESDEHVLVALARNPILNADQLAQLVQLSNPQVCMALVNHPNLTSELWQRLSRDSSTSVRSAIAMSKRSPISVLESLASDTVLLIREAVAANPTVSTEVLNQMVQNQELSVRQLIATHPLASAELLEQLAQDEKVEVRRAVAQNPNTPASIREALRDLVPPSRTSSVSPTLRSLSRLYNPNTDDLATILAEYAQSENAFVRLVTLLHPLTPIEVLEQGGRSQSWLERYATAENSATPVPMRQQLAQDSNRIVRAAACTGLA
jgi:Leucine rich repeat variant